MTLEIDAITDAVVSHAMASGHFDRVNAHEPKNAPGNGLTASVWAERVEPIARRSGLAVTSCRVEFTVRLTTSMLAEPQDGIDPNVLRAVDALFAAYTADFTLDGLVTNVDLLGAHGAPLGGRAGYLQHDGKVYRAFSITLPVIIDDLWEQAP